jgi:hypothetical protein
MTKKRCRQISQRKPVVLDGERKFNQKLLDEYREFWGGEFLGPNPPWFYLLLLHFRLQEMASQDQAAWELP